MPHEFMDITQVAQYLEIDQRKLARMAQRDKIPCQRRRDGYVFVKSDVDHWVESQLHELPHARLVQIEQGVCRHHGLPREALLVSPLVPSGGVAIPLHARTASSVTRELVDQAQGAEMIYGRDEIIQAVCEREQVCTTAIWPGVALPHPRYPTPYDIVESFVIVGRTDSGIGFGAADGSLTRLFFLLCCKDDRTHLHVLARLSRMMRIPAAIDSLLAAPDAEAFRAELMRIERAAIGQ